MEQPDSLGNTVQKIMLRELTSDAYNEQIKAAWANKDDPEEPGGAALPHLILLANNNMAAHSRLTAAEWLCRNQYGLSAAVTALIELAFDTNHDVSTKALAQLEDLDDPQATKALQGLIKWGANRDMRSTARHYFLRKTAKQKSLPQGMRPTKTPTLFKADPILYDPNATTDDRNQDIAEPFLYDESNELASDVNNLAEPFINNELNDSTAALANFDEPFFNNQWARSDSQIDPFIEPFLNKESAQTSEKEQVDFLSTFDSQVRERDELDLLYDEKTQVNKQPTQPSTVSKTAEKVELLTTSSMLAVSDLVTDEEILHASPLPVAINITASQLKVAPAAVPMSSRSTADAIHDAPADQIHPLWVEDTAPATSASSASSMSELLPQLLRHDYKQPLWLPSLLLALTTIGELLFLLPDPVLGMGVHIGVLFLLLYSLVYVPDRPVRRLNTVFLLVPMSRIMSFGLPLAGLPQMSWYFLTSIPIFTAIALITRSKDDPWSREQLGLTVRQWPIQVGVISTGIGIGWLEYLILAPDPLSTALSLQAIWLPALILLLSTGFLEELLFRGLLQSAAIPVIGRWPALIFISALFAVLHIGYVSVIDVLFVFGVGLSFALIVDRTHSILGVTLAHAIANISLYLIFPHLLG